MTGWTQSGPLKRPIMKAFIEKPGTSPLMTFSLSISLIVSTEVNAATTRFLGAETCGDHKFVLDFFIMLATILPFGAYTSAPRLAAPGRYSLAFSTLSGVLGADFQGVQ